MKATTLLTLLAAWIWAFQGCDIKSNHKQLHNYSCPDANNRVTAPTSLYSKHNITKLSPANNQAARSTNKYH